MKKLRPSFFPISPVRIFLFAAFFLTAFSGSIEAAAQKAKSSKPLLYNWDKILTGAYVSHFLHYFLTAGVGFVLFYGLLRGKALKYKIQEKFPKGSDIRREFLYSLSSIAIFSLTGLLVVMMTRLGWNHIYFKLSQHGMPYFWFSVIALILLHDTWFYWSHRAMHWPPLFKLAHKVHHQSHNPTPWAAFAFHPIEACIEAMIFPMAALIFPIHPYAASLWFLYMIFMNVMGHLGYEIFPKGFASHPVFRWLNTSTHHNMHHKYNRYNYGLYFNFWDRVMKTNHKNYESHYETVVSKRQEG